MSTTAVKAEHTTPTVAEDKAEIIEILNLYGFALDAHRWDLFDRIFTVDVHAEFGPAGTLWLGLDTLVDAFADFHRQLDNHAHTMFGHIVSVDGDKANAFSYGNWLLVRDAAEGGPNWLGSGWYDDELVRTDKGWRISRRVCKLTSWTGNPIVSAPPRAHNPDMSTNVLREFAEQGRLRFLDALLAQ